MAIDWSKENVVVTGGAGLLGGYVIEKLQQRRCRSIAFGNLEATRDWGYADAMWLALQHLTADDFVVATGESYRREFCEAAFGHAGLDYKKYVKQDERYFRPSEVDHLLGDSSKARKILGWKPRTSFKELVQLMVESDMKLARREVRARG